MGGGGGGGWGGGWGGGGWGGAEKYQREERPEITSLNLNSRFGSN